MRTVAKRIYAILAIALVFQGARGHGHYNQAAIERDLAAFQYEKVEQHDEGCAHGHRQRDPLEDFKRDIDPEGQMSLSEITDAYREAKVFPEGVDGFAEEHFSLKKNAGIREKYLRETAWAPIRISFKYSLANTTPEQKTYLQEKLLEPVRNYFIRLLRIKRNPYGVFFNKKSNPVCGTYKLPKNGAVYEKTTDLLIYVTANSDPEHKHFVTGTTCSLDQGSLRPSAGQLEFSLAQVKPTEDEFQQSLQVSKLMHQITHILGFSVHLYEYFQDSNLRNIPIFDTVVKTGKTKLILVTPKVSHLAKKYFNCPQVTGVRLEDEGDKRNIGSHFDRVEFGDEAMTAAFLSHQKYSIFTLAVLEDSGWYKADFRMADTLLWGFGEGCYFIANTCNDPKRHFAEFCKHPNEPHCNKNGEYVQYCGTDKFTNGCSYWRDRVTGKTKPGEKCFMTHERKMEGWGLEAYKLKYSCTPDHKKLSVSLFGKQILCEDGKKVEVYGDSFLPHIFLCPESVKNYCTQAKPTIAGKIVAKDEGMFPKPTERKSGEKCPSGQWSCADGKQCIQMSEYCDGSIDHGNASYGPECKDGSDEVLKDCCAKGLYDYWFCQGKIGSRAGEKLDGKSKVHTGTGTSHH